MGYFSGVITGVLLVVLAAFIADFAREARGSQNSELGPGRRKSQ